MMRNLSFVTACLLVLVAGLAPTQAADARFGLDAEASSTLRLHSTIQAHVPCTFWMAGMAPASANGTMEILTAAPTGNGSVAAHGHWTTNATGALFAGPFELASGHYRATAFLPGTNSGGFASVAFWVTPCLGTSSPLCPHNALVAANADGTVGVRLPGVANVSTAATVAPSVTPPTVTGTNLYRAEGSGDFALIATLKPTATTFVDTNVTAGASYTYLVTNLLGTTESNRCNPVEVTAVPDFPTTLALGLASFGGLAVVLARRKP